MADSIVSAIYHDLYIFNKLFLRESVIFCIFSLMFWSRESVIFNPASPPFLYGNPAIGLIFSCMMVVDNPRCFLFMRVSSQGQRSKGTSLQNQKIWGSDWADKNNGEILKDQAFIQSGETCLREHMESILSFIDEHKITHFLVYSIDRLVRDVFSGAYFIGELYKRNITLVTSSREYKNLKNPQFLIELVFALLMAHLERNSINRRTLQGIISKLQNGFWPRKDIPFGYRRDDSGRLQIVEEHKQIVKQIFGSFCRKRNYSKVAHDINQRYEDIISFKLTDKKINKILTDKIYIGVAEHGGTKIVYSEDETGSAIDTRIIAKDLFDMAQVIISNIADKYSNKDGKKHHRDQLNEFVFRNGYEAGIDLFGWLPPCPHCHSCRYVVNNGKRRLKLRDVGRYKCTRCKRDFDYPYHKMIKAIERFNGRFCPNCRSTNNFVSEDNPLYTQIKYIRCTKCGYAFYVDESKVSEYISNHNKSK